MSESYYTPPRAETPNSGMAIASLIASILGITFVPTIGSIVGLTLGYMARNKIRQSGGTIGGEGMAKWGIIVGWVGIGLAAIGICIAILLVAGVLAIPGLGICAALGNSFQY